MRRVKSPRRPVVLVVAKAPVPGYAKTRLAVDVGNDAAADIAAAALLDTLEVVNRLGVLSVVALTGDLTRAARRRDLEQALARHRRIEQRGGELGQRLAAAHSDTAQLTRADAIVQVGMDTPQLTPDLIGEALVALAEADAAIGAATDGGWWCLGVTDAGLAQCLASVPMSQSDTGEKTYHALRRQRAKVIRLPVLTDVDTARDALEVAEAVPRSRFGCAVRTHTGSASSGGRR